MKKIIAILLSFMLSFGVATSALATSDTTESTTTVESTTAVEMTTAKPGDPELNIEDTPSDAPSVEELPSTTVVPSTEDLTTSPDMDIDPEEIPDSPEYGGPLNHLYYAFINLLTVIAEISYAITTDIYDIIFNLLS